MPARHPRTVLAPLAALLAAAACAPPAAPADASLVHAPVVRRELGGGLVQRVEFERDELRWGDTLRVRSVVVNTGRWPRAVTYRVCDLALSAAVRLEDPFVRCGAVSATGPLAPGDSIAGSDARVLPRTGPDGTLLVRVHHLLDPEYVLEAYVRVRP